MGYSTIGLKRLKFMQAQLAALIQLNRAELAMRWQQCFGVSAPHLCRTPLMRQAIAWHLQTKKLGGLSLLEKRQIKSDAITPSNKPSNGSRLVRVWQDKTHQVTILDQGYLYENQAWKSLSAIAKHITGTPWSGPVFFGLKKAGK